MLTDDEIIHKHIIPCLNEMYTSSETLFDFPVTFEMVGKYAPIVDGERQSVSGCFYLSKEKYDKLIEKYTKDFQPMWYFPFGVEEYKKGEEFEQLKKDYDFCIIDTSPACGPIERSCFYASDEIIPVLKLEQFSVDGLEIFMNNLAEEKRKQRLTAKPEVRAIVLNAKDARIAQQNDNLKIFEGMARENVSVFVFPSDTAFGKAQKLHREVSSIPNVKKETMARMADLARHIEEA